MSYFEPPPERAPEDDALAEWWRAPRDELGEEIPLDQLVAESKTARVTLLSLVAYSNGFDLKILGEWLEGALEASVHTIVEPQSDQFLRIGVEFADGRRATNMDWAREDRDAGEKEDAPPEKPHMGIAHPQVLHRIGYTNIGELWIWGLPPQGDLVVVCEWPAVGIPVTRFTVAGGGIRAAAKRSPNLWPSP